MVSCFHYPLRSTETCPYPQLTWPWLHSHLLEQCHLPFQSLVLGESPEEGTGVSVAGARTTRITLELGRDALSLPEHTVLDGGMRVGAC